MVGYAGRMGGYFSSLGWEGIGLTVLGAIAGGYAHGELTKFFANYFMEGEAEPDEDAVYKGYTAAIAAIGGMSLIYGIVRTEKYPGESDFYDAIGNLAGGALIFEAGNVAALVSEWFSE